MSTTDEQDDELARCRSIVTNPDQYLDTPGVLATAFLRLRWDFEARRARRQSGLRINWPILPGGVA